MRIRRTKTGHGGPDGLPPSTATHWAAEADGQGCVTRWVRGEGEAADFALSDLERIKAHYAARPNAGLLEMVGAPEEARPPALALEDDLRDAVAEIGKLREIIARQTDQIETLSRDLEKATAPPAEPQQAAVKSPSEPRPDRPQQQQRRPKSEEP